MGMAQAGAGVNEADGFGWTPLHCACKRGNDACALLLVDAGADVNKVNNDGWTPLQLASLLRHHSCVALLRNPPLTRAALVDRVTKLEDEVQELTTQRDKLAVDTDDLTSRRDQYRNDADDERARADTERHRADCAEESARSLEQERQRYAAAAEQRIAALQQDLEESRQREAESAERLALLERERAEDAEDAANKQATADAFVCESEDAIRALERHALALAASSGAAVSALPYDVATAFSGPLTSCTSLRTKRPALAPAVGQLEDALCTARDTLAIGRCPTGVVDVLRHLASVATRGEGEQPHMLRTAALALKRMVWLAPQEASGAVTRAEEKEHAQVLRAAALALKRMAWLAGMPGGAHAHGSAVITVAETLGAQLESMDALEGAAMAEDTTGERGAEALEEAAAAASEGTEAKEALTAAARRFKESESGRGGGGGAARVAAVPKRLRVGVESLLCAEEDEALFGAGDGAAEVPRDGRLGEGGNGVVVAGRLRKAPSGEAVPVAVKVLMVDALPRAGEAMFAREVTSQVQCGSHPHVLGVRGVLADHDRGLFGIVMDLCATDLHHVVHLDKEVHASDGGAAWTWSALPLRERLAKLAGVAEAVAFMHAQQIVHGDLKPQNVLVQQSSGRLLVSDFGLAKTAAAVTTTITQAGVSRRFGAEEATGNAMAGTLPYMAPEQLGGSSKPRFASDVYSLAILLAEALSGEALTPLTSLSETRSSTVRQGIRPDVEDLEELAEEEGLTELVPLLQRMWAAKRRERPIADDVVRMLEQMLGGVSG